MKILVVSDVHGMVFWKNIIARAEPSDKIIFLGDYFDERGSGPYAESQTDNFLEVCSLARENPNVHLLLGNHDFQYTDFTDSHTTSYDKRKSKSYNKVLMDNMDLLNIVYIERDREKPIIFSHAGVSQDFLKYCQIRSVDGINDKFREYPWKFEFIPCAWGEIADIFGDNVWQTPLWIRPDSLLQGAVSGYDQVVGHTPVEAIEERTSVNGDTIYLTCTFNADYLELQ